MSILSPFTAEGYDLETMTMAINRVPNTYGWLESLGLFPDVGVATSTVIIEEKNGVLNLLQTQPRGAPATSGAIGKRALRPFLIPHNPHEDSVLPQDVQGIRAFGTENGVTSLEAKVVEKLATMRRKHEITREFRRWGALVGLIVDADASTLFNLFTEFGKSEKSVDFLLGTAGTDIRAKCAEVTDHIELNLLGETWTDTEDRVLCPVSPEFFDKFVNHAEVKRAWDNWQGSSEGLGKDRRAGFPFAGIRFVRHLGRANHLALDGTETTRLFLAAQQGRAFPIGTSNTFRTFNAPAGFNETVNTNGLPFYARQERRKYNLGMDIYTESNHLPMCARPEVLVKVLTSN